MKDIDWQLREWEVDFEAFDQSVELLDAERITLLGLRSRLRQKAHEKADGIDKPKLDVRPARSLTSREATKIIGGLIGALVQASGVERIREAVRWLAVTDEYWAGVGQLEAEMSRYFKKEGTG